MIDKPAPRKPRMFFDTVDHPSHVTFDDGKRQRRNLPWMAFTEGRWDHPEPDTIQIEIGAWVVLVQGHNLGPLFVAIEERTLLRIRARPEMEKNPDHESDTFACSIEFKSSKQSPSPTADKSGQVR
jgi:hypothetical protein